jgi:hypothetical protein
MRATTVDNHILVSDSIMIVYAERDRQDGD